MNWDRLDRLVFMQGKKVVVVGGSLGLGRAIVTSCRAEGADVLALARHPFSIEGVRTLSLDATSEEAPARVFAEKPDVVVIAAGAVTPTKPIQELSWQEFSVNWESDVRISFLFCRAALTTPLAPGSKVIVISSGAGLNGSPISGGYAGSKRMQMFLVRYAQAESDRLSLGIDFVGVVPARIMGETRLGERAIEGYSKRLGKTREELIASMGEPFGIDRVASSVADFASNRKPEKGVFVVSAKGAEAAA